MKKVGNYKDYEIVIDGKDIRITDLRTNKEIPIRRYYNKLWIRVTDSESGKSKIVALLRILYITFIDSTITRWDRVCPKDGDYTNWQLENLEIACGQKGAGRKKKLGPSQVRRIVNDYNNPDNQCNINKLALKYKVSKNTIRQVVEGGY